MTLNFHLAVAIVAILLLSTMPGFSNWKKWLYSADTFRPLKWQLARVSPVLILVATVLWLLRPSLDGGLIQAVVVFQIVVSLFLVVALLGQCVSGVGVLPQLRHDDPGSL